MSEESSANCAAVAMGLVSRLAQATMAAIARPPLKPSTTVTTAQTSFEPPDSASAQKPKLETPASVTPMAMAVSVPKRRPMRPAAITPPSVAGNPITVRMPAISAVEKPRSI